jgi:hypothetical protein
LSHVSPNYQSKKTCRSQCDSSALGVRPFSDPSVSVIERSYRYRWWAHQFGQHPVWPSLKKGEPSPAPTASTATTAMSPFILLHLQTNIGSVTHLSIEISAHGIREKPAMKDSLSMGYQSPVRGIYCSF